MNGESWWIPVRQLAAPKIALVAVPLLVSMATALDHELRRNLSILSSLKPVDLSPDDGELEFSKAGQVASTR